MKRLTRFTVGLCLVFWAITAQAAIRLAAFNIQHLGWSNGKNMNAVASVVGRFDLVAIEEVMKPAAVSALERTLEQQTGESWASITSDAVGRSSYKEHYGFVWRESQVEFNGGATVYIDKGDRFAREPLSAKFTDAQAGQSFVYATVHIRYGDGRDDRTPEIRTLDDYWQWLERTFRQPVVLAGDFNTPPDDPAWAELRRDAQPMITRGATTLSKTDNRFAHLYDNIWLIPGQFDVTSRGIANYPDWLGMTHKQARDVVSDHVPVYITFGNVRVDRSRAKRDTTTSTSSSSNDTGPTGSTPRHDGCIDINAASIARLDTLPQVGPARARSIVVGRPWHSVTELTRIPGLGRSRVRSISDKACAIE